MLDKTYNPSEIEPRLYDGWEQAGAFAADPDSNATPYTIMIPPPHVTGSQHMGTTQTFTVQDTLIRAAAQWRDVLWQPGTDHAGIATQMVVERLLADQGSIAARWPEGFVERVRQWKAGVRRHDHAPAAPAWGVAGLAARVLHHDDGLSAAVEGVCHATARG
jgi:valyl-tRNA synthetase